MTRIACMGGWCHLREQCRHYNATSAPAIAERLCEAGDDDAFSRMPLAAGTWERAAASQETRALWFAPIAEDSE